MRQSAPRVRVVSVEPLEGFQVLFTFENGTTRVIDIESYLHGPIFEVIRARPDHFRAMKVEGGTIAWDNGADIDPDVLYYKLKPAWMEEESVSKN